MLDVLAAVAPLDAQLCLRFRSVTTENATLT